MASIKLDVTSLTLDEMEDFETISGSSLVSLGDEGRPQARIFKALAFIAIRRENPEVTLEEVGRMTMAELDITHQAELDPTVAAG